MTLTCPHCQMDNAYFDIIDENGAHYTCPDCDYEWTDTSVTIDVDDEDGFDADENDEDDDDISQSEIYAYSTIGEFLKTLIKNFDDLNISASDLPIISNMYMVVSDYKKYQVNGYVHITVKEVTEKGNMTFMEVQLDEDGLSLTKGGYIKQEFGGDTYSELVFQSGNEDNLILTQEAIDEFADDFIDMMASSTKEYECIDSGDGIEEINE